MNRRISCHHYRYVNKKLTKHTNAACWAGVLTYLSPKHDVKEMFISQFNTAETKKYQKLLISTINEITPCSIVIRSLNKTKTKFIKFTLLPTYNQSLVLLNFIRNLWDNPKGNYTTIFFSTLESSKLQDPLGRLTEANMKACEKIDFGTYTIKGFGPGHSNAYKGAKIKHSSDLLKGAVSGTSHFLTN